MLSFNQLGNLGRLGNQMFQYSAIKGISVNRGFDFCISPQKYFGTFDTNVSKSESNIYNTFKLSNVTQIILPKNIPVKEKNFSFDQELFNQCEDSTDLYGYFQSEKYFKHIESEIRKDFTFLDHIRIPTEKLFKDTFGDGEVISLHVRRGDYVGNTNHPTQTLEYYEKAISLLDKNLPIIIFSDDILWCKDQKIFSNDRFIFSENNTTGIDLMIQTLCKYHIIANSSFSWWGSWLAKSKKVIAPKKWFNREVNLTDLYCENWITL